MEKCNSVISFGDDWGDNSTTFHCTLEKGHQGLHQEKGDMGYGIKPLPYTLEWGGAWQGVFKIAYKHRGSWNTSEETAGSAEEAMAQIKSWAWDEKDSPCEVRIATPKDEEGE